MTGETEWLESETTGTLTLVDESTAELTTAEVSAFGPRTTLI